MPTPLDRALHSQVTQPLHPLSSYPFPPNPPPSHQHIFPSYFIHKLITFSVQNRIPRSVPSSKLSLNFPPSPTLPPYFANTTARAPIGFAGIVTAVAAWSIWGGSMFPAAQSEAEAEVEVAGLGQEHGETRTTSGTIVEYFHRRFWLGGGSEAEPGARPGGGR